MQALDAVDDDSPSTATHTGSLIHAGVEAFHQTLLDTKSVQHGIEAALVATRDHAAEFPLHDPDDVRIVINHYVKDPRNQNAEFATWQDKPVIELKLRAALAPHPTDPTGLPIVIQGTPDQVRTRYGINILTDLKTGKPDEREMIYDHIYQLGAYWLLLEANGIPIHKAEIIRTQAYRARGANLPSPQGAFVEVPLTPKRVHIYMDRVRYVVAQIRQGIVEFGPTKYCNYCPFNGLANCTSDAADLFGFDA